jgi:hypothetical protein
MGDETPAAALALLDSIIVHPATEQTTRARATTLRAALMAVAEHAASGSSAGGPHIEIH